VRRLAIAIVAGLALADASIVTLGLPSILVELNSTIDGVALVLGVYVAVLAIALPFVPRLARRVGPARLAIAGTAVFGAASAGCGAVSSLEPLLVLRAVQALGGAALLVAAFEILDAGEPGPGRRMWVAASVFGLAVGPALGGGLTQAFDWRAIFLVQVPFAALALVAAWLALREEAGRPEPAREAEPSGPLKARPAIALALLSAALTAVVFLVVLLLVAGWSVEPLKAALAVTVLPVAAFGASRIGGDPETRAAAGCLLVAGGVASLALLPGDSAWLTVAPQFLAGTGMGLALPALSAELLPERTRADAARVLSIRNLGIAAALAILAPIASASFDSDVSSAREQGTAALLDAELPPQTKLEIAPRLFGGIDTEDPRGELQRAFDEERANADPSERSELDRLAGTFDDVVTGAVRSSFRIPFIVTAAMALLAAIILVSGGPVPRPSTSPIVAAAIAALLAIGAYALAYDREGQTKVAIKDPCQDRQLPDTGGIGGALQGLSLEALDRVACDIGSSREELLLAIFDDKLRREFEAKYGKDPRNPLDVGAALLGL
jgi:predicted MFS family arabinose efflux permease